MNRLIKTLVLISISIIYCTSSIAQDDEDEYVTTIIDNPYKIPKLYIDISPFIYNMQWNQNLSWGVRANYFLSEKTVLRGQFEMQYPKASFFTFMDWLYDVDDLYPLHCELLADLGINIPINDAVRKEYSPRYVRTYTADDSGNIYFGTTWGNSEMKHRRLSAIRVGGIQYRSNFFLPRNSTLTTTDGTVFTAFAQSGYNGGGLVSYGNIDYSSLEGGNGAQYSVIDGRIRTISDFYGFYIGYASSDIINKVVKVQNYNIGGYTSYKTFYVDLLIGKTIIKPFEFYLPDITATVYGDEISDQKDKFTINQNSILTKQNNFGFRIGWEYRVPLKSRFETFEKRNKIIERPAYFTFYHEFGLYPGYGILNNLYYKMGMCVELNFL